MPLVPVAKEFESGVPEIPEGLNRVRAIRAGSASVAVRIDARLVRFGSHPLLHWREKG